MGGGGSELGGVGGLCLGVGAGSEGGAGRMYERERQRRRRVGRDAARVERSYWNRENTPLQYGAIRDETRRRDGPLCCL